MKEYFVCTSDNRAAICDAVNSAPNGFVVTLKDGRSLPQNALLHMWFRDIAKHFGDRTALEVKGECHRDIGMPFKMDDAQFQWVWARTGAHLSREKQASLLGSGCLNFSSGMSKGRLREYMDAIEKLYRPMGVPLTDPEALKYRETA